MLTIALVNESTLLPTASYLTQFQAIAKAVAAQLRNHVAPAWGRTGASIVFVANAGNVPAGAYPMVLLDNADQAGALGYHDETPQGLPYSRIFVKPVLDNGGGVTTGTLSVSSVVSHEACELFVDQACNLWADTGAGKAIAVEVCDPVENASYAVNGVMVSDFVFPEWFDPQAPAGSRLDKLRLCPAPFQMAPGGYIIVEAEGQVTQQFGAEGPVRPQEGKDFPVARTARRMR